MRRIAAALVVAVVALAMAGARPALAGEALTEDEAHVLAHVSQVRADAGSGELAVHPGLMTMARRQAGRMAERGEIFHNEDLVGDVTELVDGWRKVGENVGVGPNLDDVGEAFVGSDVHYENIANRDFNAVGVGVAKEGDSVYVTHVFAQVVIEKAAPAPRDTEPKAEAPAEAPKSPEPPPATEAPKPEPKPDPTPDAPQRTEEPAKTTQPEPATPEPQPVEAEPVSSAVSGGVVDRSWSP